jgi:hypothetical protein
LAVSLIVAYQVAITGGIRRYEVYNEKQEKDWKDYLAKGAVIVNPPKEKEEESTPRKIRRGGIGPGKT